MRIFYSLSFFAFVGLSFLACDSQSPSIPNEEEVITTLKYVLTPSNGGSSVSFSFQDKDGDGGNDPVISAGVLKSNTNYTGVTTLLNEQKDPADDITSEVKKEAEEHQLFYTNTLPGLNVTYKDKDQNGNPLGLQTSLSTSQIGSGKLTIILRHKPDKSTTGVSTGNITNAGGETDIEVTFDVVVE